MQMQNEMLIGEESESIMEGEEGESFSMIWPYGSQWLDSSKMRRASSKRRCSVVSRARRERHG
jgi:hypothetical protein